MTITANVQPTIMEDQATPMPVIFVVFQTGSQANGGIESVTQIIERLQRTRPIVITQMETPTNRRWQEAEAEVHVWPLPYRVGSSFYKGSLKAKFKRVLSWFRTNYQMWRFVREAGSQVVHCNDGFSVWHTAFGARVAGAAVVHNIRDIKAPNQSYGWHWKIIIRLSNHTVVLSKEMREALFNRFPMLEKTKHHRSRAKVDYIYSIVDSERLYPPNPVERGQLRQRLGFDPKEFAIGYIAAFNPKKAQLAFIRKAGPLLKSMATCRVYFVGDFDPANNEYARACLEGVERLGLADTIRFVGYTDEVVNWYQALDLILLASRHEGLARCMVEGIACGTPVISFDVCSAREILGGYSRGWVIPQGDYLAIVDQIDRLATDRHELQTLNQTDIYRLQSLFDPTHIVRQYEDIYLSLTTTPGWQYR